MKLGAPGLKRWPVWAVALTLTAALPWMASADSQGAAEALGQDKATSVRALWIAHRRAQLQPEWAREVPGHKDSSVALTRAALRHTAARIRHLKADPLPTRPPREDPPRIVELSPEEAIDTGRALMGVAIDAALSASEPLAVEEPPEEKSAPAIAAIDEQPRDDVHEAIEDSAPTPPRKTRDLEEERGNLHLPLIFGKLKDGFGATMVSRRSKQEVRHTGWTITAPKGHRVRSIESGQVVLARSYRGYGLMVIVDHGGGWHSVYANLKNIMVTPGAEIERGGPIGQVGNPFGEAPPRIYFELRHEGRPLDPKGWFAPLREHKNR